MKRVLLLLALCLTAVGMTKANPGDVVTSVDGLSSTKVYAVKCPRGAWTISGDAFQKAAATQNLNDPNQWFVFTADENNEGKYFIKTYAGKGLNLDATASNPIFSINDDATTSYVITTSGDESYPLHIKYSDALVLNCNGSSQFVFDSWSAIDNGNKWAFTEICDLDDAASLAAYLPAINAIVTAVNGANPGNPFGSTQEAYDALNAVYTTYSAYTTYNNVPEDLAAATTAATEALTAYNAVEKQELTDGAHVILGNKLHTSLYVRAKETNRNNVNGGWLGAYTNKDNYRYLFTFKKNDDGTWKIYSDYYGKYVGAVPSAQNLEFQLVEESSACNFTVAVVSGTELVNIYDANTSSLPALHMTNWNNTLGGNGVVKWNTSADASKFKLITATDDILNAWNTTLTNEAAKTGTAIGYYTNTEALQTALSEFNAADVATKGVKAKALEEALAAAANVPAAGKYYTIRHAVSTDKYMTESYTSQTDGNDNVLAAALEANHAPSLWQFEAVSNWTDKFNSLYKVKAVNSANYMRKIQWTVKPLCLLASGNANIGQYDLFDKTYVTADGAVTFIYWTDEAHSDKGTMNLNDAGTIGSWNAQNSGGNNWVIEEVTEIPVTVTAAGYATLNLPFATSLPADGNLKAYKGTDAGNYLTLTEITGTIPAEEPVILAGDANTYNLTILTSATTKSTDNALSGTLTPATIADDAEAYILKNGKAGVAMYLVDSESDRIIPANKAYLGSTTAASGVKAFKFGDTTGIQAVTPAADAAPAAYYDLNGRRVLYPTRGIYVKSNGEKVFIK